MKTKLALCAVLASGVSLAGINDATAGFRGVSHAAFTPQQQRSVMPSIALQKISTPQQRSVRQSADIKLPNKSATSRLQIKRNTTAVKTAANHDLQWALTKARLEDEKKKKKEQAAKEMNEEADREGREHADVEAQRQAKQRQDDQNALSDPIGFVEKQLEDGTRGHNSQPDNTPPPFASAVKTVQDAAKQAVAAPPFGSAVKNLGDAAEQAAGVASGRAAPGFGEMASRARAKVQAAERDPSRRLRSCTNC